QRAARQGVAVVDVGNRGVKAHCLAEARRGVKKRAVQMRTVLHQFVPEPVFFLESREVALQLLPSVHPVIHLRPDLRKMDLDLASSDSRFKLVAPPTTAPIEKQPLGGAPARGLRAKRENPGMGNRIS